MKKVLFILAFLAAIGVSSAAVQLLPNTGFESYADDGYGRIMPTGGWGLWTPDNNWGNIPNVEVKTFSVDGIAAYEGDASFLMKTDDGSVADAALVYGMGQLGTNIGTGWYHVGGWFKGTVANGANIGIDIFSETWGFLWGGGADIKAALDGAGPDTWTYVGFDFQVSVPTENFNIRVKSAPGSDFQVDNMGLFTDVPEPASMALLGLGALLLRRKK